MKSQWECVLNNLGEWVGSFTTVTPHGDLIEDIPSIIKLEGVNDNRSIHLVLTRFYPLPNSTERYPKEVVWDFSSPPGVGAIYFETGAFSSGALAITMGVKTIAEFSLIVTDRRFRMIQTFEAEQQLDRITFVREYRQGQTIAARPQLTIADLCGIWQGTSTTFYPDDRSPIVTNSQSRFTPSGSGYQLVADANSIDLTATTDRLLQFSDHDRSYQILLLPDGGYATTPTQIRLGQPFYLEIGWMYAAGKRHRLVRRYDSTGKWASATLIVEEIN
jgi:Domain of unknown function (DUF3598)